MSGSDTIGGKRLWPTTPDAHAALDMVEMNNGLGSALVLQFVRMKTGEKIVVGHVSYGKFEGRVPLEPDAGGSIAINAATCRR